MYNPTSHEEGTRMSSQQFLESFKSATQMLSINVYVYI